MATRSNIGRVILQNVNETLTQYDVKGGKGVMPRLAGVLGRPGQRHLALQPAQGRDVLRWHSLRRQRRQALVRAHDERQAHLRDRRATSATPSSASTSSTTPRSTSPPTPAQPILPLLLSIGDDRAVRDADGSSSASRSAPGRTSSTRGSRRRASCWSARDDYWGEQPAVEKATYVFRTDPAVAAAMVDEGRGRPRAVDLGRRCDQPGDRRLAT